MNLLPGEVTGTGERTTVKVSNGGVAVSDYPTHDADMGRKVNVGVRPEDFLEVETGADFIFHGKVNITEALGEVTLLYFEKEMGSSDAVIAKLPGIHSGLRGKEVKLGAVPEKVHLFADGKSLLYR